MDERKEYWKSIGNKEKLKVVKCRKMVGRKKRRGMN
jgi:hypothetical protein